MKLASVRSLKEELLGTVAPVTTGLAATAAFSAFSAVAATANRVMDGIALGVTAGKKKGQYSLAVRLQRKGPLISALTEQIRKRAKGEVDVQEIGSIVKFQGPTTPAFYRARRRPLRIGSSIGDTPPPGFIAAGSLGCFVVRRRSPFYIGMLTNNHVIASENATPINGPIAQPGTLDGGAFPGDEVGLLGKVIKLKKTGKNFVDAAVGDVLEDVEIDTQTIGNLGNLQGVGDVTALPVNATVHKVGRTTGQTKGRLRAFDVDNVQVEYDLGVIRFDNQIEIEGTGKKAFSDSGDSGSLIVDDNLNAIGLLFAGGDVGGTNGKGLTFANPIQTVLDALKVDLHR